MDYTHRQQREVFHLLFLERLLKLSDPSLFVLKGGLNLRFFFNSPRFSEDMDLDVLGGSVATLRKNGYRVLGDRGLVRSLAGFGIAELLVNDPERAKHTGTTQRFRARLVTTAGETWPTKVEFSRRTSTGTFLNEPVSPRVVRPYQRLALPCQHDDGRSAALQKVETLANRTEPQVRDAFDIYVLWLGGHWPEDLAHPSNRSLETEPWRACWPWTTRNTKAKSSTIWSEMPGFDSQVCPVGARSAKPCSTWSRDPEVEGS